MVRVQVGHVSRDNYFHARGQYQASAVTIFKLGSDCEGAEKSRSSGSGHGVCRPVPVLDAGVGAHAT
jgi:hypothetical protein